MPWQGMLYIGECVRDPDDVVAIAHKIGGTVPDVAELLNEDNQVIRLVQVEYGGVTHLCTVQHRREFEEGCPWPSAATEKSTDAVVGFAITGRYNGGIIGGSDPSSQPQTINVEAVLALLSDVRRWWPDAELLLWDNFF